MKMMTNAQVALDCATEFVSGRHSLNSSDTLDVADKFMTWLTKNTLDE